MNPRDRHWVDPLVIGTATSTLTWGSIDLGGSVDR